MDFYDLIKPLGKGTFGTVYLCGRKHNKKEKIVIKKISLDLLEGDELKSTKDEVYILKSLDHPNVVRYHDSFTKKGELFIVMEYANGRTLYDFISGSRPNLIRPQKVMNLFVQILMGLDHIHDKKIIHRDLKSENIFLTGTGRSVVKIGDFGISKIVFNNKNARTIVGTCNYLAPELCKQESYDKKIDIWAMGCVLYELCALERMFEGSLSNVVTSITQGHLKEVDASVYGEQMQEIICQMLTVNPEERPDTKQLMCLHDIYPTMFYHMVTLECIPDSQN